MDDSESRQLVEAAARNDARAIEALLERYLPGLRAFVRLRAGPAIRAKESSSDLVQSICREALENIGGFRYEDEAGFKKWLYTAALHKIYARQEYYRAAKRDVRREEPRDGNSRDDAGEALLLRSYAHFLTPSRHAIAREQMQRIEEAFDRLPEDYRNVITLSRIVGLSHADIARELGRTEVAVRKLLSRAIARLFILLGESPPDATGA